MTDLTPDHEKGTRHCDTCNQDKPEHDVNVSSQGGPVKWLCRDCKHTAFKAAYAPILEPHTSPETALVVENYPYGFRLRTKIRYWIETHPKRGDRFGSQTLNPKTGQWNNPKYSTYSEVGIMTRDKVTGYIHWHGWSVSYSYVEELDRFLDFGAGFAWNEHQLRQFKFGRAVYKTREHISYSIVEGSGSWTDEQRAQHDKEQAETKKELNQVFNHYMREQFKAPTEDHA
jgi:hypothetical protein